MNLRSPAIFVLGEGSVARALSEILSAGQIQRRADGRGWSWAKRHQQTKKEIESAKIVLVAGDLDGESLWIRWHREARECPFARRVGVLLFGMHHEVATRLADRDVFGRSVATDSQFGSWSEDLMILSRRHSLGELLMALGQLGCLYRSSWERELRATSCLPGLVAAIRSREMARLHECLPGANATDWDAICFDGPGQGAHAWANRVRGWLKGVTSGVTPDWKEGLALFSPLCHH
jgi:hypothetical protein